MFLWRRKHIKAMLKWTREDGQSFTSGLSAAQRRLRCSSLAVVGLRGRRLNFPTCNPTHPRVFRERSNGKKERGQCFARANLDTRAASALSWGNAALSPLSYESQTRTPYGQYLCIQRAAKQLVCACQWPPNFLFVFQATRGSNP